MLSIIIKCIANGFASAQKADEVEQFFQQNTADGIERAVKQVVENIRVNAAWLDRYRDDVKSFLLSNVQLD